MSHEKDNFMTTKTLLKLFTLLCSLALILVLSACGSGGSTPTKVQLQPQKVTATVALQGAPETIVGAVRLDVVLPTGFVLETDSSSQPTVSALTFLVPGDNVLTATTYIPETGTANGLITTGIIKPNGFAGNATLLRISCIYPVGATLPTAEDFIVSLTTASDTEGLDLNGLSLQITISTETAPR